MVPTRQKWIVAALVLLAGWPSTGLAQTRINPDQAADYVGEVVTVCGRVEFATYASRTRGQPTFLNLGRPYPDHIFTVLIWARLPVTLRSAAGAGVSPSTVCARGEIKLYRGEPMMVISDPAVMWKE
jgi:hypothetical protein